MPRSAFPAPDDGADVAEAARRPRDTRRRVVLVGFQRQANLGLGYLASFLRHHGYTVDVLDCERPASEIVQAVRDADPVLVGLSLIFQFYVERFRAVIRALREGGVGCHVTLGGHFPSLSPEQVLALVPECDSVVRFEGELTLLELVDTLGTGGDWRAVRGLAYRMPHGTVRTATRPLLRDLDRLPYPDRDFSRDNSVLGRQAMPLLASRGCARDCAFCSIHVFYRSAPGRIVRTRRPAAVVREMRWLHAEHGVTIFLFQDDDFPLYGPVWRRWAMEFVDELHRAGLVGRVIWKISCRADAVDAELFSHLRAAGMYLVYMGLESGTEQGLAALHKRTSVEQNLRAVATLKALDVMFQFGFMLVDPASTFESVRGNVNFLRAIVGDGSAAAVFCRMVPYDGTPIREALARSGRLRGDACRPGYDFLDPRLEDFWDELVGLTSLNGRVEGYGAVSAPLNWAWNEAAVMARLFPALDGLEAYRARLRALTRAANAMLFDVIEDVARTHAEGGPHGWSVATLERVYARLESEMLAGRNGFVARHQAALLEAMAAGPA